MLRTRAFFRLNRHVQQGDADMIHSVLLRNSLFLVWFSLLAGGVATRQIAADEKPTKILLIGHSRDGHAYESHMYMAECRLLARCLEQTAGVQTVVSNRWPQDAAAVADLAAIALYAPVGANVLFDGPQQAEVKRLLASGVGLAAVHWSTGANGETFGNLWLDSLGAWFHTDFSSIEHIEKPLTVADLAHPTVRGVKDFTMHDEYYWDLRFAPQVKPLLTTGHKNKTQAIAWTFERPQHRDGRSFGAVAGHYHASFANRMFRQTVVNGILWTARREVPAEGAPCQVSEADLKLPPMDVLD